MKLCFKLLFFAGFCLVFWDGNAAKYSAGRRPAVSLVIDKQNEYYADEMVFDGTVKATPDGEDIKLYGNGRINLTLVSGTLTLEVCPDCAAKSEVYFETTNTVIKKDLRCSEFSSCCKFHVENVGEKIKFGDLPVYKEDFGGYCLRTTLHDGPVEVMLKAKFDSCQPKVNRTNKMIKLYVKIDPRCQIKVINAKLHVPEILTTSTKIPSNKSSDDTDTASFPWWAVLIIIVGVVLALFVIGFIAYYLYKKRQTSKAGAKRGTKPKATVSQTNVATIETPKMNEQEVAKAEPQRIKLEKGQKKDKKTTQEQETTEDAPAPSIEPPATPSKPNEPEPEITKPNPCYPEVKRLIPRSMKSAKTDSLDETLKKDKTAMIESMVVSLGHHCLKSADSDVLEEMKHNYPPVQHDVLQCEIQLLCAPVSKMFAEIDSLSRESEQKLTASGCEFDDQRRMVSVPKGARRYLKDKKTAATTVYFAFGAEYSRHLSADSEVLEKASVPLLYVIALQPRFPVESRRKACAILRRKLCKILGYFKASDRAKMPFPVNIVEDAYGKDPKLYFDSSKIKTDSEGDRKKKEAGQNGDGKRKKKSTKKRH